MNLHYWQFSADKKQSLKTFPVTAESGAAPSVVSVADAATVPVRQQLHGRDDPARSVPVPAVFPDSGYVKSLRKL